MKKLAYLFFGTAIFILDALTKNWALKSCLPACKINEYLSFSLALNRGVSWSMFAFENDILFYALTLGIVCLIVWLFNYARERHAQGYAIWGETLALAGALGNLYDRLRYGTVIDFVELSYGRFVWPTFNVADVAIVCGVGIMLYGHFVYDE